MIFNKNIPIGVIPNILGEESLDSYNEQNGETPIDGKVPKNLNLRLVIGAQFHVSGC